MESKKTFCMSEETVMDQSDFLDSINIPIDKSEKYLNNNFETIIFKILQFSQIQENIYPASDFKLLSDIFNTCADLAYENARDINVYGVKDGEMIHIGRLKSCKKGYDIILSKFYIYL